MNYRIIKSILYDSLARDNIALLSCRCIYLVVQFICILVSQIIYSFRFTLGDRNPYFDTVGIRLPD